MKKLRIVIAGLIMLFVQTSQSQTITKQIIGSEEYVNLFNQYAEKIGIDNLCLNNDSIRIRIWDAGKLLDIHVNKDSIYLQKIIYIFANSSYRGNPKKRTIINKKIEVNNNQKKSVENQIELICLHSPLRKDIDISKDSFFANNFGKSKFDSTSARDYEKKAGGITKAIEFSDKDNYLWTSWAPYSKIDSTIISIMNDLEMEKDKQSFQETLPNGAWYGYGGTSAWYKASFWERLYR